MIESDEIKAIKAEIQRLPTLVEKLQKADKGKKIKDCNECSVSHRPEGACLAMPMTDKDGYFIACM